MGKMLEMLYIYFDLCLVHVLFIFINRLFDTIKEVQNYLDNQSLPQEPIVSSFVRNPENVQEFLIKNLSFPRNLAESFLQARVNTSKFGGTEAPFVSRLMPLVVFGVSQAQNRVRNIYCI